MTQLIECVPNFSEGRDRAIIAQIADRISTVSQVRLLNVDPGKDANRTVMTFVGPPEAVVEAAFQAIQTAGKLIDMRSHAGEHPRMGATDVCPLIPVAGISMEETAAWAARLAKRVGEELGIPVYLYEQSQADKTRSNLSVIRTGEYEGWFGKIKQPGWAPDAGPSEMNARSGATVIGARDFLVAYNVNLNTSSVPAANAIAFEVRETGRRKPVPTPGKLKAVKAIGWYIEEYGRAQVSMNLTNLKITPVHLAFEEVCKSAAERGIRVTGSELIGLIPLRAMLEAGRYFLTKQGLPTDEVSDDQLVHTAVMSLGLDDLAPFHPQERIIEYLLANDPGSKTSSLLPLSLEGFADEVASASPAPGGGSVAAYAGALAVSLATMVARISKHHDQTYRNELLTLVEADTAAFNAIMSARALPRGTAEEKAARQQALSTATLQAIEIPFRVMELAYESMALIRDMAEGGNPNAVSDAGVAAVCARAAVLGAFLNVKINAAGLKAPIFTAYKDDILTRAKAIADKTLEAEAAILSIVEEKINR